MTIRRIFIANRGEIAVRSSAPQKKRVSPRPQAVSGRRSRQDAGASPCRHHRAGRPRSRHQIPISTRRRCCRPRIEQRLRRGAAPRMASSENADSPKWSRSRLSSRAKANHPRRATMLPLASWQAHAGVPTFRAVRAVSGRLRSQRVWPRPSATPDDQGLWPAVAGQASCCRYALHLETLCLGQRPRAAGSLWPWRGIWTLRATVRGPLEVKILGMATMVIHAYSAQCSLHSVAARSRGGVSAACLSSPYAKIVRLGRYGWRNRWLSLRRHSGISLHADRGDFFSRMKHPESSRTPFPR